MLLFAMAFPAHLFHVLIEIVECTASKHAVYIFRNVTLYICFRTTQHCGQILSRSPIDDTVKPQIGQQQTDTSTLDHGMAKPYFGMSGLVIGFKILKELPWSGPLK